MGMRTQCSASARFSKMPMLLLGLREHLLHAGGVKLKVVSDDKGTSG